MTAEARSWSRQPLTWSVVALLLLGVSYLLAAKVSGSTPELMVLFVGVLCAQGFTALAGLLLGLGRFFSSRSSGKDVALGVLAILASLPPLFWAVIVAVFASGGGGGWGRPLRVRGRQVHPDVREGGDWERGERPDPAGLDAPTREALEALWLHDAQKEHASVPAFARVSWLLAAAGAPPELLRWSHRAALQEIAHARLCFSLAAGYGGRSHTVQPMPELLHERLGDVVDVVETLIAESLGDGCQLEDFNADIAAECAAVCEQPVTRAGLERIAREERSHAEFSWAVIEWLVRRDGDAVHGALERAIRSLPGYQRPTAVSAQKQVLVNRADPAAMRRHGRLPDQRWAEVWRQRLVQTEQRAQALLDRCETAVAAR